MAKKGTEVWLARAAELPTSPGVYLMKDAEGRVIYVGKAKNLRARVRQYFQEGTSDFRAFIGLLGGLLASLETVVARSEKEALLLERELIRSHEPRFNVIWKDDKQYLCLRIDPSHEYPWVQVVRNFAKDGARYFGPYHSASAARQTLRVVNRHFRLRTCRDSVLYHRTRPCLEYQIGRCPAPCVFEIDRDAYKESVGDVIMFLEGKGQELAEKLEGRMWSAADATEYEAAAHYRNQLKAVQKTLEKQQVALEDQRDQDVFGLHREGEAVALALVEVRGGRVRDIASWYFENIAEDDAQLLEAAVMQRYRLTHDEVAEVPEEVLVPLELDSRESLAELLSEKRSGKVRVVFPQRGDRASLLALAQDNAEHGFEEKRRSTGALERTLEALQEKLHLKRLPARMECFDISNLGAQLIVGSRVVFVGGQPAKKLYRHYRVESTEGQDDFASLFEVLKRRFSRGIKEADLPDLVVIDGGKGQLNQARAVLKDLGIESVELISLAKSRIEGTDLEDRPFYSPERVFLPGAKEPIVLKQTSPELLLLARLRDEAHRFAITFHRELRQKSRLHSILDDIPGVGPTRKKALLSHLGSLKRVREADVAALAAVPGIGPKAAEAIFAALHADPTKAPDSDEQP